MRPALAALLSFVACVEPPARPDSSPTAVTPLPHIDPTASSSATARLRPTLEPIALEPIAPELRARLCDPKSACDYWEGSLLVWRDADGKVALVRRSLSCRHHPMVSYFDASGGARLSLPSTVARCPEKLPEERVRERELVAGLMFHETIDCEAPPESGPVVPPIGNLVRVEQLRSGSGGDDVVVVDAFVTSMRSCAPSVDPISPELAALGVPSRPCPCDQLTITDRQRGDAGASAIDVGAIDVVVHGPHDLRASRAYRMRLIKRGELEIIEAAEMR